MAVNVVVVGSLKTRGSLWFPEDVFIVQAAVGRVSYRQAGDRENRARPPQSSSPVQAGLFAVRRGRGALVDQNVLSTRSSALLKITA